MANRRRRKRSRGQGKNNKKNSFVYPLYTYDSVVLPNDVYREQSETVRAVFDVYDYLPFIQVGELEHLNALANNSSTLQSILNKVATYVVGKGFVLKEKRNVLGDEIAIELSDEQKTQLWKILTRKNQDGDDVLDVCRKSAYDFKLHGNTFGQLEVVDVGGTDFVFLSHQYTTFVRPYRTPDLKTRFYGVSYDWATVPYLLNNEGAMTQRQRDNFIKTQTLPAAVYNVPAYPMFEAEESIEDYMERISMEGNMEAGNSRKSMLHVKQYAPEMYFWGLPDWIASKHWVELEYRIAKFNVSKFKNGLTPSGLLQLFGDLDDETARQYLDDMRNRMTDTGNDFKVIFQLLENPDLKANWTSFEQTYNGYFMELATLCKEFIAIGTGMPLSLVQASAGQLGSNQQLRSEFELLYNTEIREIQDAILKGIVKPYLDTVAEQEGIEWLKEVELDFRNIVPLSFKGDLELKEYLTIDEGREVYGYPALEIDEQTVAEEEQEAEAQVQPTNLLRRLLNKIRK